MSHKKKFKKFRKAAHFPYILPSCSLFFYLCNSSFVMLIPPGAGAVSTGSLQDMSSAKPRVVKKTAWAPKSSKSTKTSRRMPRHEE